MSTKRQQTMAKITRERLVKERRERKLEKKQAAAAEKQLRAQGLLPPAEDTFDDPLGDAAGERPEVSE
jgi:hypothetical protein